MAEHFAEGQLSNGIATSDYPEKPLRLPLHDLENGSYDGNVHVLTMKA